MIKTLSLSNIPAKIGEAEIAFEEQDFDSYGRPRRLLPRRVNKTIVLPEDEDSRFYPLLEGRQFLFTTGAESARQLYFGGMDESPFLVRLHFAMMENLVGGEEEFFLGLKPARIKEWEAALKVSAKRQGDFFAVPFFNTNWGAFLKQHLGAGSVEMRLASDMPLRNTRHQFTGLLATGGSGLLLIGDGVIKAPDHEPLELPGPHLIEQAIGFVKPEEAD